MDRLRPREQAAHGDAYVNQLYDDVFENQEGTLQILEELSGIAMGGHPLAQKLVNNIDDAVSSGELTLTARTTNKDSPSLVGEASFIATHPILSLRVMRRQINVAIEVEAPPHTSTWEEFPDLPISQAAKAIKAAEQPRQTSGVPKEAWSKSDQELMARGELPKGYPEHPNV